MERREVGKRLEPAHDLPVDEDRVGELAASVHDPVPDGVGIAQAPAAERVT